MTNKKIEKLKQELHEIQGIPEISEQFERVQEFVKRIGALIPHKSATVSMGIRTNSDGTKQFARSSSTAEKKAFIDETIRNIYTMLQTEMMFNACIFAKHSCFWAAIAAIVACISTILVLFCG
jgi:hypothetical protein